jgi:hypothetical protein
MLVSRLVYSWTLKMEATFSSEKPVDFQRNTCPYISEDRTLHNHRSENLKSYIVLIFVSSLSWVVNE